jgi:hypothetical protein
MKSLDRILPAVFLLLMLSTIFAQETVRFIEPDAEPQPHGRERRCREIRQRIE